MIASRAPRLGGKRNPDWGIRASREDFYYREHQELSMSRSLTLDYMYNC